MKLFKSAIISFSLYSIIPMPKVEWDKESIKYTFIFFPWIGLLIGVISYLWMMFSSIHDINNNLEAVILAFLPLILSGGIHMDGLIDTCDALFSYGDKEKKLEILKDSRTGAFGTIGCVVYLLFLFGIYSQLIQTPRYAIFLCLVFFVSRSIGAFVLLTVKKAKRNGLGTTFAAAADNRINLVILAAYLIFAGSIICTMNVLMGVAVIIILSIYLAYYIVSINKNFGGITGDLTGFLISSVELILLIILAIGGCIIC